MADPLYAGKMGPATSSTTPNEFVDSMAQRIEDAYWALLAPAQRFDRSTNSEQDRDRRRMFVAIAQGVVEHMHDHQGAFRIEPDSTSPTNLRIRIDRTP
jgi:hypothetical protein